MKKNWSIRQDSAYHIAPAQACRGRTRTCVAACTRSQLMRAIANHFVPIGAVRGAWICLPRPEPRSQRRNHIGRWGTVTLRSRDSRHRSPRSTGQRPFQRSQKSSNRSTSISGCLFVAIAKRGDRSASITVTGHGSAAADFVAKLATSFRPDHDSDSDNRNRFPALGIPLHLAFGLAGGL